MQLADFESERIEGYTNEGNHFISVPLFTEVETDLFVGGNPREEVPREFSFVLDLYGAGGYRWSNKTIHTRAPLYDVTDLPDLALLEALASWVNTTRSLGSTLVHCQAGLNRSSLVVALALIRSGQDPGEVILKLRTARSPAVLCNKAFEAWLRTQ
jgi:hypothetical protein